MQINPYPTQPGFSKRVAKAIAGFRRFSADGDLRKLHTRSFDDCFDNFDGKALVWALMEAAVTDKDIERHPRDRRERLG